ncbi:capsid maturation protease and VIP2-like ADP-ribosyltransferase toxin [Arthrobacter phage KeAlii]|uniref:Capsid maturation protease and VIP2-like ADP-ribosyltransferase toxin n=1 Tax=Arthrobacter phage KeAlii TaxID=2885973 RepID=A0AA94X026_9CAUD|nr:head maturation protease [Arthrobacter phage KeAlii]UDL14610.1 capsid maturation protease and VIP2-like ADP-ribosyltransferase toxin [Arthrobacter phage KeAlii]
MAVDLVGLSQDHMRKQVRDAAAVQAGLAVAFDKGLKPSDLDGSFPTYLRSALALVSAGRGLALKTATDYYGAAKAGSGFEATIPAIEVPKIDIFRSTQALLMTGPVAIKKQLSTGVGLQEALNAAKKQTLAVGKRLTLEAPRQGLIQLVNKDTDALGWSRVSDGQPCYFCAMLLSRGPAYKSEQTARFRAHNGCGCSVRPFFKGDPHNGWTKDQEALRRLWDGVDEDGNELPGRTKGVSLTQAEWRSFYSSAVNDPESPVFRVFTEKVAAHIASPAIVAARKSAQSAYEIQRKAQKEAEEAARAAETAAAKKAAEEEAKKAAAEAAKIKKWKGKPAPVKPVEPKPASTLGPAAFDQWLEDAKKRFKEFADKTGNPKNDLTLSLNWTYFQKVVNNHDKSALSYLKSNHYIDDKMEKDALEAMKKADEPIPGAAAAYKKELTSYRNRLTRYKRYLEEWREVNGITSTARGMDDALLFGSNHEAVAWANQKFPPPPPGAGKDALIKYTGGSYRAWNQALREHANGDTLPPGSWKTPTKDADGAFTQAPEDFIVTRGTGWDEFASPDGRRSYSIPPPPPEDLIGTVQTQHGYTSTAMSGATDQSSFSGSVQMKIRVPEGYPVAWVDPFSQYQGEREMLLARSTSLYIHNVYKSNRGSNWIVEAEVIPKGVDPASFAASATPTPASKPFH